MATVPETTPTAQVPVVFNATLDGLVSGLALRDQYDRVFFLAETTGLWTRLGNHDRARLQLHGHKALADAQALVDGDLVTKCSRTLVGRAAA